MSKREIETRVKEVRHKLEAYALQLQAAPFDIVADALPRCLDSERDEIPNLVDFVDPLAEGLFNSIVNGSKKDFKFLNDVIFNLKSDIAKNGFDLGVLAGVIFSGARGEVVDRFERGLAYSLCCNGELCKND